MKVSFELVAGEQVPLAQRIARWTSNPKVLGSIPRWDDCDFCVSSFSGAGSPISFLSVAVITCASHAQGRRFEPGTFGLEVQRAIHCATGT